MCWISLSKTYVYLEGYIFCIREKDQYVDTESDDKESLVLLLLKTSVLFYPWL